MKNYKIIAYSPENRYAADYYKAFHQFADIRDKLIKMENSPNGVNGNEYERLIKQFRRLDSDVPRKARRANFEEYRIEKAERRNIPPKGVGEKLDIMG